MIDSPKCPPQLSGHSPSAQEVGSVVGIAFAAAVGGALLTLAPGVCSRLRRRLRPSRLDKSAAAAGDHGGGGGDGNGALRNLFRSAPTPVNRFVLNPADLKVYTYLEVDAAAGAGPGASLAKALHVIDNETRLPLPLEAAVIALAPGVAAGAEIIIEHRRATLHFNPSDHPSLILRRSPVGAAHSSPGALCLSLLSGVHLASCPSERTM